VHFVHVNSVHLLSRRVRSSCVAIMFTDAFDDKTPVSRLPFGRQHPVVTQGEKEFQELIQLLEEMNPEFGKDDEQSYAIIRSLLHALLLKLTRRADNNHSEQSVRLTPPHKTETTVLFMNTILVVWVLILRMWSLSRYLPIRMIKT